MYEIGEDNLEGKTIGDLPNEILLAIFSYLQTYDLKYIIPNVCVQWANLSTDSKLWKRLNFETINKTTKTFGVKSWYSTLRFLETTPQLQNVTVSQGHSPEEVEEILTLLNKNNPNIRKIEFNVEISSVLKQLKKLSTILEKVDSLILKLNPAASQTEVFKTLSEFKNLKSITFLDTNPQHKDFDVFLNNCPLLDKLNVANDEFCKTNFLSLFKKKETFSSLYLKIDNLDEGCVKQLRSFPNLISLMLMDSNLSPEKLYEIGRLKCLKSLHLKEDASSPVLTASALTEFFREGSFSNLKELKLHKSRLNDEGAIEIRRNCKNLKYLEVTTYPRCKSGLSEKGLLHILHCKSLENFEIIFDNSDCSDWIYRRIRHFAHACDIDADCPFDLEVLLQSWDEIQIPID